MAGLAPGHSRGSAQRTTRRGTRPESLVLLAFAPDCGNVDLVFETARRGWPGQAWSNPAMTASAQGHSPRIKRLLFFGIDAHDPVSASPPTRSEPVRSQ